MNEPRRKILSLKEARELSMKSLERYKQKWDEYLEKEFEELDKEDDEKNTI